MGYCDDTAAIYYNKKDFERSLEDFNQVVKLNASGKIPASFWRGVIKRDYLNDDSGAKSDFEFSIKSYSSSKRFSEQFGTYDVRVCEPYFKIKWGNNALIEID